jgi:hypothetical protein
VNAWGVYKPSGEAPWDLHRVVHLHRRAGFAAARDEIERDLEDGPRIGGQDWGTPYAIAFNANEVANATPMRPWRCHQIR